MSTAFASHPWSAPPASMRGMPWVFGREVTLPGACRALQWLQRRNASMITPRQLGLVYVSLCAVSLLIGAFFLLQGAPLVLAFAGAELLAVGLALLLFARHASDREVLTLVGRSLQVEQCFGSRVQRTDFAAAEWISVEPAAGQGSLVELSGRGQQVRVGRFLRPELRSAFARELRQALRRGAAGEPNDSNSNTSSR